MDSHQILTSPAKNMKIWDHDIADLLIALTVLSQIMLMILSITKETRHAKRKAL